MCQGARGEQGLVGVSLRYVLCLVKRGGGRDWMGRDGRGKRARGWWVYYCACTG